MIRLSLIPWIGIFSLKTIFELLSSIFSTTTKIKSKLFISIKRLRDLVFINHFKII